MSFPWTGRKGGLTSSSEFLPGLWWGRKLPAVLWEDQDLLVKREETVSFMLSRCRQGRGWGGVVSNQVFKKVTLPLIQMCGLGYGDKETRGGWGYAG